MFVERGVGGELQASSRVPCQIVEREGESIPEMGERPGAGQLSDPSDPHAHTRAHTHAREARGEHSEQHESNQLTTG